MTDVYEPWVADEDDPSLSYEANPFHEVPADIRPVRSQILDGDAFVFGQSADDEVVAIWGTPVAPLWTAGEGLMIVAPEGVGKTTLAQQLVLARIGLRDSLLGRDVVSDERPVLYLALDRPRQIKRSLERMVGEHDRQALRKRLVVWKGPLEEDIAALNADRLLVDLVLEHGAGTLVVDSLKDAAVNLSDDAVGGRVNRAFQHVIGAGVELLVLHHPRKSTDNNKKPNKLSDVYGSRWITAGMGSVFMLWGEAGDVLVELNHLKQPLEKIGPLTLIHDHQHGRTTVDAEPVLDDLVAATRRSGLTVADAARQLFRSDDKNAIERARRRLENLAKRDGYERRDDEDGTARYYKTTLEAA